MKVMKASELVSDLIEMISKAGDVEVGFEDQTLGKFSDALSVRGAVEYENGTGTKKRYIVLGADDCFYEFPLSENDQGK